jgi:hypothetical protein
MSEKRVNDLCGGSLCSCQSTYSRYCTRCSRCCYRRMPASFTSDGLSGVVDGVGGRAGACHVRSGC